jgi:hypothetical protein
MKLKTICTILLLGAISQLYGANLYYRYKNLYYRYNPFFKYYSQCARYLCNFKQGNSTIPSPNFNNWLKCIDFLKLPTLQADMENYFINNASYNRKVLNKLFEYFNRDCKYMLRGLSRQTGRRSDPLECIDPKWVKNICA